MPILTQQNVLWLDVPVDHFILMQIGKAKEDLYNIEPRYFLADSFILFDESKELSSRTVLDYKDEKFMSFKCELHIDEEGMIDTLHDVTLIHDEVLLLVLDDHLLIDHLHRVEVAVLFEPAQKYLRKTTRTYQLYDFETVQTQRLPLVHTPVPPRRLEIQTLAV